MNGAHLHLIVNELPIIAVFTSAVLLAIALVARARDAWVRAGCLALAAAVVGAAAAFFTGDPAVDVIAGMPRTSNRALSQHHTRASIASLLVCVAALASVVVFARAQARWALRPASDRDRACRGARGSRGAGLDRARRRTRQSPRAPASR